MIDPAPTPPEPGWLCALRWIATGALLAIIGALVVGFIMAPTFMLQAACFTVVPAFIAIVTLVALLMRPVDQESDGPARLSPPRGRDAADAEPRNSA